jgi:hypothetical protein
MILSGALAELLDEDCSLLGNNGNCGRRAFGELRALPQLK